MWKTILTQAFATLLLMMLAAPASQAGDSPGRYSLTPIGGSLLRLDSATGAMSVCGSKEGSFVCEAVADDALAMKHEIDRLAEENEAMRLKLLKLEAALNAAKAESESATPPATPGAGIQVPELNLDKVAELASRILERFEDVVRSLKQEDAAKEL
jgi:hypothetical protein